MSLFSKKKNKQEQDLKQDLKVEVLEKMSSLATAGFGLVAALAWNDAIKAFFAWAFPRPQDNLVAKLWYAVVITVIVVIITIYIGRAANLAKNGLKKGKK